MADLDPNVGATERVRDWYNAKGGMGTDLGSKVFDWKLVEHPSYAELLVDKRVVNLGSGAFLDELVLMRFGPRSWDVVDFSATVIQECQEWQPANPLPVRFHHQSFLKLPFDTGSIDTVLDFSSTDHVPDHLRPSVRHEIFRVLASGGHYVCSYPNARLIEGRYTWEFGYERRFTPEEIVAEMYTAGFQHVVWHEHVTQRSGLVVRKP